MKEVKNDQLAMVVISKDKLNVDYECYIKAKICRKVHRKLEIGKAAGIIGL